MDQGDAAGVMEGMEGMEEDTKQVDSTDALSGGFGRADPGTATSTTDGQHVYRMDYPRRGMALIINNKEFDKRTNMNKRSGTDVDAANLYQRLSAMGFDATLVHNQTTTEMLRRMAIVSQSDHSNSDCFVCAILSHGDEGIVYGTDGTIQLDVLINPVKGDNCKSLLGKPKLFIIQACRGNQLDHGVDMSDSDESDGLPRGHRIPFEADVLLAFSTVPGYYSWRNSTKGSWFVQALSKILERYGSEKEIMWILTRVNHAVAFEFESNASQEFMNKKKQIPCIQSMLTKELYFRPKK